MNHKYIYTFILGISFLFSCNGDKINKPTNPSIINLDTVNICNQTWMTKNLDVDRYRNGDIIPNVTDPIEWSKLKTGAWCYYNNDSTLGKIHGKLYNWYAVNDPRGLAPDGWHIPNSDEWDELRMCLGGVHEAGGKIKIKGTKFWNSPNTGATNSSNFFAIPNGYIGSYGSDDESFHAICCLGVWWHSNESELNPVVAWHSDAYSNGRSLDFFVFHKEVGLAVRCVKNQ